MPATQTELAKRLGLSRSTIAAALNPNSPTKLRPETIERVRREARKLNYRPNPHARLVRGGRSGMIGIFHYGGLSQVAAERLWFASRAIQTAGYQLLSTDLSWAPGGTRAGCEAMLDARVEGVIVAGLNDPASLKELEQIRKQRIPIISLSGNRLKGVPHVRGDACAAMKALTKHLIQLGRRRLTLLAHDAPIRQTGGYLWAFAERRKGFESAITEVDGKMTTAFARNNQGIQGRVIANSMRGDPFDPHEIGRRLMEEILRETILPDAVLCGNDDWAVGAMAACLDAGVPIPEQIALTGYDNNAFCQYLKVPLTSIAQPSQLMAEYAVEQLLRAIHPPPDKTGPTLKLFPCTLVIRKSCGSPN